MKVIYTTEPHVEYTFPTIFLAGPSPRGNEDGSWRPEAEEFLRKKEFNGLVYNPEQRTRGCIDFSKVDYPADWEDKGLDLSDVIIFWVPRDLKTLPGFTTNIEFGRFVRRDIGKVIVYGRPDDAPKNKYLDWLWKKEFPQLKIHNTLEATIDDALKEIALDQRIRDLLQAKSLTK